MSLGRALMSANSTVTCLRSPSKALREVRIFSARYGGCRLAALGHGPELGRGGDKGGAVSPVQTSILPLVPGELVHLDDFVCKNLQQRIVELELHLERSIRHTSATPEHLQCLFQDLVEGHGLDLPNALAAGRSGRRRV